MGKKDVNQTNGFRAKTETVCGSGNMSTAKKTKTLDVLFSLKVVNYTQSINSAPFFMVVLHLDEADGSGSRTNSNGLP